jgi:hypothetical protein
MSFVIQMSSKSVWPHFVDQMMAVTTEDTSGCNVQVYQNLVSQALIAKDDFNEAPE